MGSINSAALKADAVEGGLYDYILLGVNTAAYLMPGPRGYTELIPETTKLEAVLEAGRSAVITGSQYVLISYRYRPNMVPTAGGALSNHRSHF
jgi:hypothetical protein